MTYLIICTMYLCTCERTCVRNMYIVRMYVCVNEYSVRRTSANQIQTCFLNSNSKSMLVRLLCATSYFKFNRHGVGDACSFILVPIAAFPCGFSITLSSYSSLHTGYYYRLLLSHKWMPFYKQASHYNRTHAAQFYFGDAWAYTQASQFYTCYTCDQDLQKV